MWAINGTTRRIQQAVHTLKHPDRITASVLILLMMALVYTLLVFVALDVGFTTDKKEPVVILIVNAITIATYLNAWIGYTALLYFTSLIIRLKEFGKKRDYARFKTFSIVAEGFYNFYENTKYFQVMYYAFLSSMMLLMGVGGSLTKIIDIIIISISMVFFIIFLITNSYRGAIENSINKKYLDRIWKEHFGSPQTFNRRDLEKDLRFIILLKDFFKVDNEKLREPSERAMNQIIEMSSIFKKNEIDELKNKLSITRNDPGIEFYRELIDILHTYEENKTYLKALEYRTTLVQKSIRVIKKEIIPIAAGISGSIFTIFIKSLGIA